MSRNDLSRLYELNRKAIVSQLAARFGSNVAEAEEALQDIVVMLLEHPQRLCHLTVTNAPGLLYRAVQRQMIRLYHRREAQQRAEKRFQLREGE